MTESFPFKTGNETWMLVLIPFNQYNTEVLAGANKERKGKKGIHIRKEEIKLP